MANGIDKFHDRFWHLKAVLELDDFNGVYPRIIASIPE